MWNCCGEFLGIRFARYSQIAEKAPSRDSLVVLHQTLCEL